MNEHLKTESVSIDDVEVGQEIMNREILIYDAVCVPVNTIGTVRKVDRENGRPIFVNGGCIEVTWQGFGRKLFSLFYNRQATTHYPVGWGRKVERIVTSQPKP